MVTADKRSVATDALATLGTIIDEKGGRDAIHLAVNPTYAQEKLYPGQDVGADGTSNNPVGIVDPFLKSPVMPGERFWLVVYPRQIDSLRHVWTHPAFPAEPNPSPKTKELSEKWLREFAVRSDVDYDEMMAEATTGGGNMYFGSPVSGDIPFEFWDHVEILTDVKVAPKDRATYFSCSC